MTADASEHELEAMLEAAKTDGAARPAFIQALLAAKVFVLGTIGGPIEPQTPPEGNVHLGHIDDPGGPLIPFFTSEAMLRKTMDTRPGVDPGYLHLPCRMLWESSTGVRYILNPNGPTAKIFEPAEVAALLAGDEPGRDRQVVTENHEVRVGAAAHIPEQLPIVLARFLATRPVVAAARLGWIKHPDGARGYLLTVAAPDREAALEGFGSLGIGDFTDGNTIDVMVEPDTEPPRLLPMIEPFYRREDEAKPRRKRFFGRG
jgi:SseB protein N-terminal domain/SseB protein C-terminal domain